jgi:hypothetical protein
VDTDYEVRHYTIISTIPFLPFKSKYPQHSALKNPHSMFLPQRQTNSRTHTAQLAKLQFCVIDSLGFERIVLLDFIHRLVSQKIEE